jgi:hypothetical protein
MRLVGVLSATLAAILAFAASPPAPRSHGDEPLASEAIVPLTKLAKEVAKAGRSPELDELLEAVQVAGLDAREAGKLATACRADAAKVKKPAATLPSSAKSLQQLAATLAARLGKEEAPRRSELARLILKLDGQNAAAHGALGREKVGGEWLDEPARARRRRRAEIGAALVSSRKLEVKIEVGRSENPIFFHARERPPSFARCGPVTVHGTWPADKLERVLRDVLRALAFDNFLVTGDLALPVLPPTQMVFFDSDPDFAEAIHYGLEKRWIARTQEVDPDKSKTIYAGDELLGCELVESSVAARSLLQLLWFTPWKGAKNFGLGSDVQTSLVTGITNWTCLECFGSRMALYLVDVTKAGGAAAGGTASLSAAEQKERERLHLLSEAGISGGRAWMRYLAARREDPPLATLLVDQLGKLQGDALLKMTLVVEMLGEDGPLLPLLKKLTRKPPDKTAEQVFEAGCGAPLPVFDAAWRDWLQPPRAGLAERLTEGAKSEEPLLPAERQAVDALNELRHRAGAGDVAVELDREASDACRKHALYLAKNPDQLTRWPDAHEEYSDRPGFDPAGGWAGTHSVIFPGVKDGRAALDGWMATFYHRLPLLEPGVVRIGFALEGGTAVLDSGSFVREHDSIYVADCDRRENWCILWPPDGAKDVPTRYSAELPQPVPGEDETKMGYPVTLQLTRRFSEARPDLELALRSGGANGAEVACWWSTPTQPTNPKLAPDSGWCLIPKAPLQPGAQYTVTGRARWSIATPKEVALAWSFRTGR